MSRWKAAGCDLIRMVARDKLTRERQETSVKVWSWKTRAELLVRFNQNEELVDSIIRVKRRDGLVRENPDAPGCREALQYKMLNEQSETESDMHKWTHEMKWEAKLTGEDAEAFSREAQDLMEDATPQLHATPQLPTPGAVAKLPTPGAAANKPTEKIEAPAEISDSEAATPCKRPKASTQQQSTPEKPDKPDKPDKTKEQKETERKTRALEKEASLPERVELKAAATGKDLLDDVDDFTGKLLSTAQESAYLAAKRAFLPEEKQLTDKLVAAEKNMKDMFHKLNVKRSELTNHTANDYSELIGKAVILIENFRKIEHRAKPFTKTIGGTRKTARTD